MKIITWKQRYVAWNYYKRILSLSNKDIFDRHFKEIYLLYSVHLIQMNNIFKITAPMENLFGSILSADG